MYKERRLEEGERFTDSKGNEWEVVGIRLHGYQIQNIKTKERIFVGDFKIENRQQRVDSDLS